MACAIFERISGLEPASKTTVPRYLKLVTVCSFCPVTFISIWVPLALFFILYIMQVLSRFSTSASSSYSSSARATMSSANRRLIVFLPPMVTFPSCSSRASDMIRSRKMLKTVDERRHLQPYSDCGFELLILPFIWTAIAALL